MDIPVTPSQRSLVFVQEAVPRKDLYNISFRAVFDGPVDVAALRYALDRLVRIQPTLRTQFDIADGEPRALLVSPEPVALEIAHLNCLHRGWAETLEDESRRFASQPIDLQRAPLCAFRLLTGPRESALLCNVHHAISDGVSMRVFLDELVEGYQQALAGDGPPEPDVGQRERWLVGELAAQCRATRAAVDAGELAALAAALVGVPPTTLNPVPDRPADTAFRGRLIRTVLPVSQRSDLERVARSLSTTPYCVLLACYSLLLGDYSGNSQVIVGGPFVNRRTIASHDLCGFFVNTLPVALPAEHRVFADHCAKVSEAVRAARRFQSIPFDLLVAAVAPERATNRNPIFQCMFAMQDKLQTRRELSPGVGMLLQFTHNETAKFDIWLAATPVSDGLELELEWDADLLSNSYVQRFFQEYQELLRRVIADPTLSTADIAADWPSRSQPELRLGGQADIAGDRGLLALVLDAAERHPGSVAIAATGATDLTYGELVARAGQIAAGLAARGVSAGDVVGVAGEALHDTVAAMLAILWCGATYLPVDRSLAGDQLSRMLSQADARFVISSRQVAGEEPPRAAVASLMEEGRARPAPPLPSGRDPVYVMFTSGSSDRPKGVRMGQRPLVNLLRWQITAMEMGSDTRFLQVRAVRLRRILPGDLSDPGRRWNAPWPR